ncbi:polysaccharide deacetylase family protein [candidate division KSB1 bacterium]|nr:polysaccharide deacetylase family protein [candidate division KSB1 bacterium]
MKKTHVYSIFPRTIFLLAIVLTIISAGHLPVVAQSYEVGTWPGFRSAAICFTFDDNCSKQLSVVVPMFNEFDFHLTLFTVTTWGPNWTGLQAAADSGHEVASHTVTHPHITGLPLEDQTTEFRNSYNTINSKINGQTALTMAYPYCEVGDNSIVDQYYIGARGCQGFIEQKTPGDFRNISSIICGTEGSVKTAANFNSKVNSAANMKGICVFLIHGVDDDGGWSPTNSSELRTHLEYLKKNVAKFWIPTFGNMIRYVRERNAATITELSVEDSIITLQASDTLDDSIYNLPITIRRPLPDGWLSASATQNGNSLNTRVIEANAVKYIMFDVIPDGGDIILSKSTPTDVHKHEEFAPLSPSLSQNYPNPFNPETLIRFQLPECAHVNIEIINTSGQRIATLADTFYDAGDHTIQWDACDNDGNRVASGVYFYQLYADNYFDVKRMIVLR